MGVNRSPEYEVHVEELVIDGFETTDRVDIVDGLRSGLERAFTGRELIDRLLGETHHAALDAGRIDVGEHVADARIGEAAGAAVARAVRGGRSR